MPSRSSLKILDIFENGFGGRDTVAWRFLGGPAQPRSDFGDPTSTTDQALCIYADGVLALDYVLAATPVCMPMGPCCGPCWRARGSEVYKYLYRAQHDKVLLVGSTRPRTKILFEAGALIGLTPSTIPFSASTVAVRLHNSANPNCWGADFPSTSFSRNDEQRFTADVR